MPSRIPRSEAYQGARDDLAREVKFERKTRDIERKKATGLVERAKAIVGMEHAGTRAEAAQQRAEKKLAEGKQYLEPLEQEQKWREITVALAEAEDWLKQIPSIRGSEAEKMWLTIEQNRDAFSAALQDPERLGEALMLLSWVSRNGEENVANKAKKEYRAWLDENLDALGLLADKDLPKAREALVRAFADLKLEGSDFSATGMIERLYRHRDAIKALMESDTDHLPFYEASQMLGVLLRQESPVIKEWVFRAVEDIFQRRGRWNGSLAQLFGDCVGRDGSETEQFQRQFITAIVRPLGLDGDKMAEAWRLSGKGHEAGNIRVLAELERRVPGIAKRLESQFGIRCFDRYPVEVLERQAEENETDRPYGVIVMSRGDHSGAFYRLKDAWGDLQRDIGDTFAIRIVEAGSKFELGKRMLSLDRRYGQKQKISFAVINGHGVPNQVRLGAKLWYWQMGQEIEFNQDDPQPRDVLDKSDFLGTGFRRGKEMFKPHPTIVLFSCSTGAPEGVAQELARTYEADVLAPSTPASLEKMHATVEDGEVKFDIKLKLNGEGETMTYSGK